jgi:hypothetical protein
MELSKRRLIHAFLSCCGAAGQQPAALEAVQVGMAWREELIAGRSPLRLTTFLATYAP